MGKKFGAHYQIDIDPSCARKISAHFRGGTRTAVDRSP
jgi:hypothetical protein